MFFRKITGRNDLVSNAWQQPIPINIYESKVECFDQESVFSFSKPSQQFNKGPPFFGYSNWNTKFCSFPLLFRNFLPVQEDMTRAYTEPRY